MSTPPLDLYPNDSPNDNFAPIDWRDPAAYAYTDTLDRDGWAWEFLRRNPEYRADFARAHLLAGKSERAAKWGCYDLEDPSRSALEAKVLWRSDVSDYVLILHGYGNLSEPPPCGEKTLVRQSAMRLQVGEAQHSLFLEGGRRLQIESDGESFALRSHFSVDLRLAERPLRRSLLLLRRLAMLVRRGHLPAHLYRPDSRSRRFKVALQALDGSLAHASQQTIARAVFGARADGAWRQVDSPLRNRVRRAIQLGRRLMQGDYLSLLK